MDGRTRSEGVIGEDLRCPECGGPLASQSGCELCLSCGLSRCMG